MIEPVVSVSKNVQSGAAVFKGTRVPIQNLFQYLAAGDSVDEFLLSFPSVSREQVDRLLSFVEIAENDGN